ncbi:16S rRNA (uracil(1498)-N(3))-methyltransferase [Albidovulum sp.]
MTTARIRLFLDQPLAAGQSLALDEGQAHYLFGVMREGPGSRLLVFNGEDGEWLAEVSHAGRRGGRLLCVEPVRPQVALADLWLLFAPVKKARTDFIVEKAVELGAARIVPVLTDHTRSERFRADRARAHVREAAEQCGALTLPEVVEAAPLAQVLAGWDAARQIVWADESASGEGAGRAGLPGLAGPPAAVLIGPEGGFSPAERERLRGLPFVRAVSLGPRILRAETAAIAALALWQARYGDWG